MKKYPAILGRLYNTPHLIAPGKLEEIAAFMEALARGVPPAERVVVEAPEAYCLDASGERAGVDTVNATAAGDAFVAVLPLFGTMQQHGSLEVEYSGGTSCEQFGRQFDRLVKNAAVKTIVIEAHSPGGGVYGTSELSDLIFAARDSGTRVVAAVNSECASAALWVATAAAEVYVTPGGQMGSVGVVVLHREWSKWEEQEGIKTTIIATPAKKAAGNPFEPLGADAAAEILAGCEKSLSRFVAALARNRGCAEDKVRSDFGAGGMLRADEAVKAGLADGVAAFRDVLAAEVGRLRGDTGRGNAKANARAIRLADAEA